MTDYEFQAYDQKNVETASPTQLRIYPGRNQGYLTAGAVDAYLSPYGSVASEVAFHHDRDRSGLAIDPSPDDDADTFAVSDKDGGASVHIAGVLRKAYGVDVDDLDQAVHIDLEKDGSLIIAELTEVVERATDDVHCEECGRRCTAEGLSTHKGKKHGIRKAAEEADPDEVGPDVPDGDDTWKDYQEGSS